MKKKFAIALGAAAIFTASIVAISQGNWDFETNNLAPNDLVFQQPITLSENQELTIVSFNIRDMRGTERTLEDFQEISRLLAGADIVVFQEFGVKGFGSKGDNEDLMERLRVATTVIGAFLQDEWEFVFADTPSPEELGAAAEIACIGYRLNRNGIAIKGSWSGYYDLGDARDMGTFKLTCTRGSSTEKFTIGSVHTKPTCPGRGKELLKIADYIDSNVNNNYILMGDFNWGYYSTCSNAYDGETRISEQHDEGKVMQLFHEISYIGKGKTEDYRTNLDVRTTGQMYDQFLICKNYAGKLSAGGSLGKDCGFVSFSNAAYFEDRIDDVINDQLKGVKAYMKSKGFAASSPETKAALEDTEAHIRANSLIIDEATFKMSDHKPIWMRINLF